MTRAQIVAAVRAWLRTLLTLTGDQVIPAQGPGSRPAAAHIAIRIASETSVSTSGTYTTALGATTYSPSDLREVTVELDAYGASAEDWLSSAAVAWGTAHSSLSALRTSGLGCGAVGQMRDLTTEIDGTWEPRRLLSLTAYHRATLSGTDAVGSIETIIVDGDLQPDGVPVYVETEVA